MNSKFIELLVWPFFVLSMVKAFGECFTQQSKVILRVVCNLGYCSCRQFWIVKFLHPAELVILDPVLLG